MTLRATGAEPKVPLFQVTVNGDGRWRYESRGVAGAQGRLSEADRAQLQALYDKVEWNLEVLNGPISRDARIHFELAVTHDGGDHRLYQFNEELAHRSWQFRDLVHFLRHNIATAGDPVGFSPDVSPPPDRPDQRPPLPM